MAIQSSFAVSPGTVVGGRYRLGQLLGRGGMAEVYAGIDQRLGRDVAVKLLQPQMAAREDIRDRFEAEARAAAGLSHPNAVAVFDTGEHEGVPFLVMERLPGETLADRIKDGPVDQEWMRVVSVGLLGALGAAHRAGIVHRDVKPGNILLTDDGSAKLADFGIAKSLPAAGAEGGAGRADVTDAGQLLGTPAYLAPERLEGNPATARSDLWAFGVVLYEALAARKPYDGRNPLAVAQAVVDGTHVPLLQARPGIDPAMAAVVERAMATNPKARYASAEDLSAALSGAGSRPVARSGARARGRARADATVPEGGTMILPAAPLARMPRAPRAPRALRAPRRRGVLVAVAAAAALALIALAARGDGKPLAPAVADRQAAIQPTTTAAPVATSLQARMRAFADSLDLSRDGARAADLANGMRQLAAELDAGSPAAPGSALGLAISAAAWRQTGQLSDAATAGALSLLRQVPGVASVIDGNGQPLPQVTAPAPSTAATVPVNSRRADQGQDNAHGKGKGKD